MGNYNTTTGTNEDSLTLSTRDFNGSTYVFEKFDNASFEGRGSFSTDDTTVNFTCFASEDLDFETGKPNDNYTLIIENDPAQGQTSSQEFYRIKSYDETNISLEKNENTGWSTTPFQVTHSYISFDMNK